MNRWLLPAAVAALLVVGWQHRGQRLALACSGALAWAIPGDQSVAGMGSTWKDPGAPSSGVNPLLAFCSSLAQRN
jgi:hypothetical protein